MGNLAPSTFAGVVAVDGFLTQRRRQFFQRTGFFSAQEDGAIHVSHNGVCAVLIQGFELALRLQDKTAGNLSGTDRCHQLFQTGYLPDIRRLVDQTAHMDRQAPSVHIVCFFAEQIKELGVTHGNEKVKGIVRIGHDDEQGGFSIAQGVQLQFVVGCQFPKLLNIKGRKARTAANQDAFCGLAGS